MTKQYDRAYFEHWYRNRQTRVNTPAEVRRKVAMAVASCEYFLRRQLRSALDIGCGEGAWLSHLRAFRPKIAYTGLDSSEYVVGRFGRSRNIHRATFGELPSLRLPSFDLVVCSDVLHYVEEDEIRAGVDEIARICEGVAFLEILTAEDEIIGDLNGLIRRPAGWYRNVMKKAGFTHVGPYTWASPALRGMLAELETP